MNIWLTTLPQIVVNYNSSLISYYKACILAISNGSQEDRLWTEAGIFDVISLHSLILPKNVAIKAIHSYSLVISVFDKSAALFFAALSFCLKIIKDVEKNICSLSSILVQLLTGPFFSW